MRRETDLHLRERTSRVCRLSPAEVRHLLTHHRHHLDIIPDLRADRWRLTPRGHVGTIVGPERRFHIAPKIPLVNLALLLDPAREHVFQPEPDGDGVLDLIASRLGECMSQRAALGLHRAYREQSLSSRYLVGRLDLADHLRTAHLRREQIPCVADAFTLDLPCNQIPIALAGMLLNSGTLSESTRGKLHRARAEFAEVSEAAITQEMVSQLRDAPTDYAELVSVCQLLLENRTGSMLVSLERLFEGYITRLVQESFPETQAQGTLSFPAHEESESPLVFRPDLLLRGRCSSVVIDAKWKILRDKPAEDDLHQILAYATLTGATESMLLYPGGKRVHRRYQIPGRLQVRTVRVSGDLSSCREDANRLKRHLQKMLRKSRKSLL